MEIVKLLAKGIVVGIANVIPGVSTGTFLVLLGVYDRLIGTISNFLATRDQVWSSIGFLVFLGLGAVAGTLGFANLASHVLDAYPVTAQLLFIGLIAGSVPSILKMHHDMAFSLGRLAGLILGFAVATIVGFAEKAGLLGVSSVTASSWSGLIYFGVVGVVAGGAVITPGMSGAYIFLLAGTYEPILEALASLTQPPTQWGVIFAVAVGASIGVLGWSKLIDLALKRRPAITFYTILGLVCGSIIGLWPAGMDVSARSLLGVAALGIGFAIAYVVGTYTRSKTPVPVAVESTK